MCWSLELLSLSLMILLLDVLVLFLVAILSLFRGMKVST
ncbi:hypothetical protein Lser_V15G00121 [Lactuca serriola]